LANLLLRYSLAMNPANYILTIDLGTSGPKVAIFTTHGRLIDYAFEEVPLLLSEGGGAEQRPSDWISAIGRAWETLLRRAHFEPSKVVALNCTSQWSGTVCLDASGQCLGNAIIWMDSRGAEEVKKAASGFPMVEGYGAGKLIDWIRLTGGAPTRSGKDPIAHILWLKAHEPERYRNTAVFLEPKDYLNYYLTGRICSSWDCITLHWVTDNRDIRNIKYSDKLIRTFGIDRNKLPDLVPVNSLLGNLSAKAARDLGLPESVQVVSGTPDLHSAAVGSGAVRDFEGHYYIGTSSWLITHLPFKKTDLFHNMGTIPSGIPGRYLCVNEQETAGACLNFIRNQLFFPGDRIDPSPPPAGFYKLADEVAAEAPAGCEGLTFAPWLYGERSPVEDHHSRGMFFNVSLQHKRAHFVRAVMEGVALNGRWLLKYVEAMAGRPFGHINFIGGGANSKLWSQIIADVFNRPVHQMKDPLMANSRGAALLAAAAIGLMDVNKIGEAVEIEQRYEPQERNRRLFDERFEIFTELYKRNKPLFHRLNS